MQHWWLLGIRNWRVKPGRTAGAVGAIALGVGVVIWVTCAFESLKQALQHQAWLWIGKSHVSVISLSGARGTVDESIADKVKQIANVEHVTRRLNYPMEIHQLRRGVPPNAPIDDLIVFPGEDIQVVGIDPETEYFFRDYAGGRLKGRLIESKDTDAAIVERQLAESLNLKIGDRFILQSTPHWSWEWSKRKNAIFTVSGLLDHRRVAKRQLPIVLINLKQIKQLAHSQYGASQVTKIDVMLKDTSGGPFASAVSNVNRILLRGGHPGVVTSSQAKLNQFKTAEKQTGFVLLLLSSVALFTAVFIIFSTLSIGMTERIGQMGILRCLGLTRRQIATLVLSEAVPMGLIGILLGIPVGLFLAWLTVKVAPDYVGQLEINYIGMLVALAGGAVTTLAGAILPMLQAMRVSPLDATRPRAHPPHVFLTWLATFLGLAMIVGHSLMIERLETHKWIMYPGYPVLGVTLLFCGYALITPGLVILFGRLAVWVVAVLLAVRHRLLNEQVGRAAWRSGTICCGLMVGLSLVVTMAVHAESLSQGWNFPKEFFEAFVYPKSPVPYDRADKIRKMPGVADSCLINYMECSIFQTRGLGSKIGFPRSLFIASHPDDFFKVAKLHFVEGDREEAIGKLKKGGYVLVTPEFTRIRKVSCGDKISIKTLGFSRRVDLEIAGVVSSPALEVAANFFNVGGLLANQAVHVALGTLKDAQRIFKLPDEVSLFLINFDLPEPDWVPAEFEDESLRTPGAPADFAEMLNRWVPMMPERGEEIEQINQQIKARGAMGGELRWNSIGLLEIFRVALGGTEIPEWLEMTAHQRWQRYRENLVMGLVSYRCGSVTMDYATVRGLKDRIDRDLRRATALMATVPMVALIVAALGVANLMMANVASRSQQIAMLRAIGTTKSQVTRLVVGEALVLGAVGCLLGVALGMHAAYGMKSMTTDIWGFKPIWTIPWGWLCLGIGFTMLVCLLAGVLPARRAARNNIIDAMQTT
ncbi:MAG: FtsX-like permease family protein [Planctomycetota bacterium]|jgi:ABC-type antimicrobial peptide transport system permease subunit